MKRQRVETDTPASIEGAVAADASDTNDRDALLSDLAAWCDQELREAAEQHTGDIVSLQCENSELIRVTNASFEDFLEAMNQDQRVTVEEHKKGCVAEAWRQAIADATRLNALTSLFTESSFASRFHSTIPARDALKGIMESSTDLVDEWYFALGYELAGCILSAGGKQQDSEDDSEDEPVDDDDSDDEGDEEDDSDSGSDSSEVSD